MISRFQMVLRRHLVDEPPSRTDERHAPGYGTAAPLSC
jgi:hypothetical protein